MMKTSRLSRTALRVCGIRQSARNGTPTFAKRPSSSLAEILRLVQQGTMNVEEASKAIGTGPVAHETQEETLASFANLDYERSKRTGFPEAVFAEGKTSKQVASILDDMARNVNESMQSIGISNDDYDYVGNAILATRYVGHLFIPSLP
jgi:NCAIR mutase (PurE)-related protein